MSGVQRKKFYRELQDHPTKPTEDIVEIAKSSSKVVQVIATITASTHGALRKYAFEREVNQDDATVDLIEMALGDLGFMD